MQESKNSDGKFGKKEKKIERIQPGYKIIPLKRI